MVEEGHLVGQQRAPQVHTNLCLGLCLSDVGCYGDGIVMAMSGGVVCRQLFVIYGALKDPTFRRVSAVINGATIAIATLYFLVSTGNLSTHPPSLLSPWPLHVFSTAHSLRTLLPPPHLR